MEANWIEQFEDFGTDPFLPFPREPVTWLRSNSESPTEARAQLRLAVCREVPKMPGVYGMIDEVGRLIYVGKSKALRNRLLSYFMPNSEDEKAGRIIDNAKSIVWERQPSEFASLLREQFLIRNWQPRFNVIGMPKRQQPAYLCLGKGPAEQIYVSRQLDPSASVCQGPFYGAGNLMRAVEILNRHFKLRDCSQKTRMQFTDQLSLFDLEHRAGCIRQELLTCLAPCMPGCARSRYREAEELAAQFLMGEPSVLTEQLEHAMNRASTGRHFEHAAKMRDDLQIVKWLSNRLAAHRKAREGLPMIYHEAGDDKRSVWYLIRCGGVEHCVEAANNAKQWYAARQVLIRWLNHESVVAGVYQKSDASLGLVTSWFQRNRNRKGLLISLPNIENVPNTFREMKDTWLRQIQEVQRELLVEAA